MLREHSILLVQEDPSQAKIITDIVTAEFPASVFWVENAEATMDFLRQQGRFKAAHRPNLILLDLDLPDGKGHSLLTTLKKHPSLCQIPVVALAFSEHPEDILNSYTNRGNCYVVKSRDMLHFTQVVQQLSSFWLGIVTLPM